MTRYFKTNSTPEEGTIRYARSTSSPSGYVQRDSIHTPWVNTPEDDAEIAHEGFSAMMDERARDAQELAALGLSPRSEGYRAIAESLGLSANEMSERLARPDMNQGTLTRLPEAEFDQKMEELGFSPEDARARFKGTFWQS